MSEEQKQKSSSDTTKETDHPASAKHDVLGVVTNRIQGGHLLQFRNPEDDPGDEEHFSLSEDEVDAVTEAMAASKEYRSDEFTEVDVRQVLRWASDVNVASNLLDLAIEGDLRIDVVEGNIVFAASTPMESLIGT